MPLTLKFTLLGGVKLTSNGMPLTDLRSQKAVALLAYLACNPRPFRREHLANLLWDANSTAQSLSNLRTVLTRLRHHLNDSLLVTRKTLAIDPASVASVDVIDLEEKAEKLAGRISSDTAPQLEQALALYQGEFLSGFHLPNAEGFQRWVVIERERVRFLVLQAHQELATYYLRHGNTESGIRVTKSWLDLDPLDEDAHSQMIRLLAHSGQRKAALAHYDKCRQLLLVELDVEPNAELQRLYRQVSEGTVTMPAIPRGKALVSSPVRHTLPQRLTSFIDRETEMAVLRARLAGAATRLITITGEGGVGKSALAISVGQAVMDRWRDGVHFVPLLELEANPVDTLNHRLASVIAEHIGLSFSTVPGTGSSLEQLFDFLRDRSLLLILDNFEHLTAGAAFVSDLLQTAPKCRVLVTTRKPLRLQAESVVRLDGLPVPQEKQTLYGETPASVALFAERARQRKHTFSLSLANQDALGHLCRLVAGNPLALELAAAWVEHYSVPELTALLEKNMLDLLRTSRQDVPERHQSLRRVLETSWRLLPPDGREMLAQLSIFQGSFRRKAALEVTNNSIDTLRVLVNASLVQQREAGRYELHEMVSQFAGEQLAAFADGGYETARRHAHTYLALVSQVERTPALIQAVAEDLANVRQAWAWAVKNRSVNELASASIGLWNFYLRKGLFEEAEAAFGGAIAAALAVPTGTKGKRRALASLRVAQAVFLNIGSRYTEAMEAAEEAIGYALQEENETLIARGYLQWGTALYRQGRYRDAVKQYQMALMAAEDAGLEGDEADILRHLGMTWLEQDEIGEARARCEDALAIYHRTGDRLGEGNTLNDLGWICQRQHDYTQARDYLQAAHRTHAAVDNRHGMTMALINLAGVHQTQGDFSSAYDAFQQALRELDKLPDRYQRSLVNYNLGVLLSRMGDYTAARRHSMAALTIDRSIGDRGGQAWAHNALGLVQNRLGDHKAGLAWHKEALRISRETNARTVEGLALLGIGQNYHGLGLYSEAQTAYEEAIAIQTELKQHPWLIESQSCLARTLLAQNRTDDALSQVERILVYLSTQTLDGAREPAQVYWNCYRVLQAQDDARALAVLAEASDFVWKQAFRISDEKMRHSYLYRVPFHKEIIRQVAALHVSELDMEQKHAARFSSL